MVHHSLLVFHFSCVGTLNFRMPWDGAYLGAFSMYSYLYFGGIMRLLGLNKSRYVKRREACGKYLLSNETLVPASTKAGEL